MTQTEEEWEVVRHLLRDTAAPMANHTELGASIMGLGASNMRDVELYTTPLDLSYPRLEGEKVEGVHVKEEVRSLTQSRPHHYSFIAVI